jgi:photosystem II stability/assembly factor-like uncharacterized protein
MKKNNIRLFIFSLAFCVTHLSDAQWIKQSAIPTGRHLSSAYFITPSHGFVVGINHILMETTDAGATWTFYSIDALGTDPYYCIAMNGNIGFITGNYSTQDILRTLDGGQTWNAVTNFPGTGTWNKIDFVSPNKVYFGSNGACVFTSDGGNTYTIKSGYPDCPVMYGMDFRDEQVGLVAGTGTGNEGIYKTSDGAVTWQQKSNLTVNDVLWWNDSVALAIAGTQIYRSTDEGETWNFYSSGITTGLLELERIDNTSLAGISGKGDVWRSANGGLTWTHVFDGPGDLPIPWSIHFSDSQHGWVVGQSGFMYSSIDGGLTWQQVSNGCGAQITALEMLNTNFGMAVGENGYVFKTTNGGNWWDVQKLEVTGQIFGRDESLHGISVVDANVAVAAGPGGTVFRTLNGGLTWQSIGYPNLPGDFWIEDVKFTDMNNGWIVGLDQGFGGDKSVYKTTDGGLTWTQPISDGAFMVAVDFPDALHGYIATLHSSYRYTTDGGASWQSGNYPPYFMTPTVSDIDFIDANNGWVVGWDGFVTHTSDGGATWANQDIGTITDHLFSVQVISPTEVWASGREADLSMNGVLYHSIDGGATWTREITTPYPYWGYALAATPSRLWFAGYEGIIYTKDITTGIYSEQLQHALQALQAWPNPFNNSTSINYIVSNTADVKLTIFDMLGKEVAVLVNENKKGGMYKVSWNPAHVQPGIYYCQFVEGKKAQTIKLILQ